MIRSTVAWLRFSAVIASMAIMVLAVLIIYPFSKSFVRQQVRMIWTRCLIASTGAKLYFHGYPLSNPDMKNSMVVANHISWMDTVVMYRTCFVQFIGKIEMLQWPILNRVIQAGGTIFINRKNKKELINVNQHVAQLLREGASIGLFPEGKTSVGKEVLPFKAPLLEAARMAESKIFPVVLSYRKSKNRLAREVSFAKVGWMKTVMNTLRLQGLTIDVTVLPPVAAADFADRELLANYLHQQISEYYKQQQIK
jgi:1-acyl-sn-glycerol-3-phosphate acyltransferase